MDELRELIAAARAMLAEHEFVGATLVRSELPPARPTWDELARLLRAVHPFDEIEV